MKGFFSLTMIVKSTHRMVEQLQENACDFFGTLGKQTTLAGSGIQLSRTYVDADDRRTELRHTA
jgi:hypothetical protein